MQRSYQQNPLVSVIIPVYNDERNLQVCLQSVFDSTYTNYEAIVVDDGSKHPPLSRAKKNAVNLIALSRTCGPAFARNQGAAAASGDILFFLDADVQIYPDTLSEIVTTFETDPEIAAVIGSYDDSPANPAFLSQYKNLFHHYVHQSSNADTHTFWAACGAIRRTVFNQAGGFDERYRTSSIEDIELGHRLRANGNKIRLNRDIQVKHLKRWTLWGLIKADICRRGIPWTKLILTHKTLTDDLNLRWPHRICVLLVCLMTLFFFSALFLPIKLLYLVVSLTLFWVLIFLINIKFYLYLTRKRNLFFALFAYPMHLLYFWYCGLSFILGFTAFIFSRKTEDLGRQVPEAT